MKYLPYEPGMLPSKPSPNAGEKIIIKVNGYPPYKDRDLPICSPRHPNYQAFVRFREAAISAMNGRAWYSGPVAISVTISAPSLEEGITIRNYVAGIENALGGSSGSEFTYLPIVFEDDCQVVIYRHKFIQSEQISYVVEIELISNPSNRNNIKTAC